MDRVMREMVRHRGLGVARGLTLAVGASPRCMGRSLPWRWGLFQIWR